jgi:uncharacterized protein (TIGR00661 family)
MVQSKQKTILFCPLHWGWGHMTRDLPLIKAFYDNGHHVIVAASPTLLEWLNTELPQIETTLFKGPEIRYSKKGFAISKFFLQLPNFVGWLSKEKKRTFELTAKFHPDLIVSDNRYGARHPKVFSAIITHQLMIKLPFFLKWLEYPLHLFIKWLIGKFDECWIPDFSKKNSLAGDLVHKYSLPSNAKLIGPLSRFDQDNEQKKIRSATRYSVLGIISGPEPQRTILEKKLKIILQNIKGQATIISGKIDGKAEKKSPQPSIRFYGHLPSSEMLSLIDNHQYIIARPGYSTLMDMYFINKQLIMVPTPGQTEQEYLAEYNAKRGYIKIPQAELQNFFVKFPPQLRYTPQKNNGNENFRSVLKDFFSPKETKGIF